ncbi:hypothetical protein FOA52_007195 [Chlamydomonas sp. UWO 241]|nr:hypothetical protein FOA52_007195 [Chlamydomonas sp. UWO 241]
MDSADRGSKDGSIGLTSPTPNLEFLETLSENNSRAASGEMLTPAVGEVAEARRQRERSSVGMNRHL